MDWERHTRGRWRAPGFEIRAATVAGQTEYQAVRMGDRYTWLGVESEWFRTAADARVWCERKQRVVAQDGRA